MFSLQYNQYDLTNSIWEEKESWQGIWMNKEENNILACKRLQIASSTKSLLYASQMVPSQVEHHTLLCIITDITVESISIEKKVLYMHI